MTGELRLQTVSKTLRVLICMLLGFSHNDCEGVARLYMSGHIRTSLATSGVLSECVQQSRCGQLRQQQSGCGQVLGRVCQKLTVCRQKFVRRFSINLVYLKTVQSSRERYCVYETYGCSILKSQYESMILLVFGGEYTVLVISNYLDIRSVWDSLVSRCVYMDDIQMHIFNALSPALKCLSPVRRAFVSSAKSVCLQCNKRVRLLHVFGSWFRNPQKQRNVGKGFCKSSFQLGIDLKKVQK